MIKKLNKKLTLYFKYNFPKKFKYLSSKRYLVTIGIGGNIGNMKRRFDKLLLTLKEDNRFDILLTSPLLKNPPFGFIDQDYFINAIIKLKTNLYIKEFLRIIQRLEYRFKRTRSFKDAPRTLDIDIIFFDNKKINTKKLTIPHKSWYKRDSVLIPLKYM